MTSSITSLVGRMIRHRLATPAPAPRPVRTPAPLGLCQGASVAIPMVPCILARSAGGIMPELAERETVVSVGCMRLFGHDVYRSYLGDGRSFIETTADPKNPAKSLVTRLYTLHTEILPGSADDVAFLLGSPPRYLRDSNTQENVVVAEAVPALIGWPLMPLAVAGQGELQYPRQWSLGAAGGQEAGQVPVAPEQAGETVVDGSGVTFRAEHRMMLYGRHLDEGVTEYLVSETIETDEGLVWDRSIGLDVMPDDLSVLSPG